jgi:SAM-dependent methyltransferase
MEYKRFDKDQFEREFSKSLIYQQLAKDYPVLYTEADGITEVTRDFSYKFPRAILQEQGIFVCSSFYYIEMLLDTNPKVILDVGCGDNVFKKYIPQIVGLDPMSANADIHERFDDKFVEQHTGKYDCAMALQSIHHVSLLKFVDRINQFGKIIKPGGRGFFSTNLSKLVSLTELHEFAKIFDLSRQVTIFDYYCYLKKELKKLNYRIIAADVLPTLERHYYNCAGPDWPSIETYAARDFSNVSEMIKDEILGNDDAYVNHIGLSEVVDGNIKIVFEV